MYNNVSVISREDALQFALLRYRFLTIILTVSKFRMKIFIRQHKKKGKEKKQ